VLSSRSPLIPSSMAGLFDVSVFVFSLIAYVLGGNSYAVCKEWRRSLIELCPFSFLLSSPKGNRQQCTPRVRRSIRTGIDSDGGVE
jgi:hypothetical protein